MLRSLWTSHLLCALLLNRSSVYVIQGCDIWFYFSKEEKFVVLVFRFFILNYRITLLMILVRYDICLNIDIDIDTGMELISRIFI